MVTLAAHLLLLMLASSPIQPFPWPRAVKYKGNATISEQILSSMETATIFLGKNKGRFTLGHLMAFSMVQVQLKDVRKTWAKDPLWKPLSQHAKKLSLKMQALLTKCFSINRVAVDKIKDLQPITRRGFWKLPQSWIHTNDFLAEDNFWAPDFVPEKTTKECIVQLLGNKNNNNQPCNYSHHCMNLLVTPGVIHSYQLTYFLLARMVGCKEGLFAQTLHHLDFLCANMMDVNKRIEKSGYPYLLQDLFLENIMSCGIVGYANFYPLRWLNTMLNWQNPQQGCFEVLGECNVHQTGLAVGALGGFLYFLTK